MNQSQEIIFDLLLMEAKGDTSKILRKFRGVVNILKKKTGLDTKGAVEQIIMIINSGVDPDKLSLLFKTDIDRFFKGKAFFDPVTDVF